MYERVPYIRLKSIANNAEINVIWDTHQPRVQGALDALNKALRGHKTPFHVANGGRAGKDVRFDAPEAATFAMPSGEVVPAHALVEWEVPREAPADWPTTSHQPLATFWSARIERQREMDKSIAAKADTEYLYDKPYEDKKRVRVAGPFTVESLSPHRMIGVDEDGAPLDLVAEQRERYGGRGFAEMILENLQTSGGQQAHKEGKITFASLVPWPGRYICAEGRYTEGTGSEAKERRAGIFIGPEFGTISRPDLVEAAREAADARFDVVITCGFNYDAASTEFTRLGNIHVLKARMNADLHMADDLKNTGKGNLFVVFGEPDIALKALPDGQYQVQVLGVDVFKPSTGKVESSEIDDLACWFLDTNYNQESFFVRHAYFLGAADPYKALKTTLKAEVDEEAWSTLKSATPRPFPKPNTGRIPVKVINILGDEVIKVIRIE